MSQSQSRNLTVMRDQKTDYDLGAKHVVTIIFANTDSLIRKKHMRQFDGGQLPIWINGARLLASDNSPIRKNGARLISNTDLLIRKKRGRRRGDGGCRTRKKSASTNTGVAPASLAMAARSLALNGNCFARNMTTYVLAAESASH